MKKTIKRVFSAMLAAALAVGMAVGAMAQDAATAQGGSASIKITNASVGETYSVYKVFDAEVTGTSGGSIVYKVPSGETLADNAYFKVENGVVTATEAAKKSDTELTDEASQWLYDNYVKDKTALKSVKAESTPLVFSGLQYGYYIVTSSLKDDAAKASKITVTSTNPTAEIVDKNTSAPTWDGSGKVIVLADGTQVTENDISIGVEYTFKLTIDTKNFVGEDQIKEYIVKDTLPAGMDFVKINSVKVGETDLTASYTNVAVDDNNAFQFTVAWADGDADNGWTSKYESGSILEITYIAKLNSNAVINGSGNKNTAQFFWNFTDHNPPENPDTPDTPDGSSTEVQTTTYTSAFALKKIDETGKALTGAKFRIPFTVSGSNGNYVVTGTADLANGAVIEVGADGVAMVTGAEGALNAGKAYAVLEDTAPTGYNKIEGNIAINVVRTSETKTDTTIYLDADGNVTNTETQVSTTYKNDSVAASVIAVVNKTGSTLPSTGGIGTKIFYTVGGILMAGAVVLLITKKKMANGKG